MEVVNDVCLLPNSPDFTSNCRVMLDRLSGSRDFNMVRSNIKQAFRKQLTVIVDRLPQGHLSTSFGPTTPTSNARDDETVLDSASESLSKLDIFQPTVRIESLSKLNIFQPTVRIERIDLPNSSMPAEPVPFRISSSYNSRNDLSNSGDNLSELSDSWDLNFINWANEDWEYPDLSLNFWQDVSHGDSNDHEYETMGSNESVSSDGYNSEPENLPLHFQDPLEFQGFRELFVILRNFNNFELQPETFGG